MHRQTLTAEQALKALRDSGVSIRGFAQKKGLPYATVYAVLHGRNQGLYGTAHAAAVALGIKTAAKAAKVFRAGH